MSAASTRVVQPSPYLTIVLVGEQPLPTIDGAAGGTLPQNVVGFAGRPGPAEEEPTWEDAEWQ